MIQMKITLKNRTETFKISLTEYLERKLFKLFTTAAEKYKIHLDRKVKK